MFTGIIQAIGKVREPEKLGNGVRLTISAPDLGLDQVGIGESIAVNGACMTVVEKGDDWFRIDVSAESLSKTAGLDTFGPVNLERPCALATVWTDTWCRATWMASGRWCRLSRWLRAISS